MPPDPTLSTDGPIKVRIEAQTVHAGHATVYLLPPGKTAWEQEKVIATSGAFPAEVDYTVTKGTYLGWNLTVATYPPAATNYQIVLHVAQNGSDVAEGALAITGTTAADGVDIDLDSVKLR